MNCVLFSENYSTDTSFEQKGFVPQVLTHELSIDFRCGEASPSSNTIRNCISFTFLPFMKLRRPAEPTEKYMLTAFYSNNIRLPYKLMLDAVGQKSHFWDMFFFLSIVKIKTQWRITLTLNNTNVVYFKVR